MHAAWRNMLAYALFAPLAASAAADAQPAGRYALHGGGSVSAPAAPQVAGRYALRAVAESPGSPPAVQVAGRFALDAVASANSLVCYNDTLFRDSFDGSGL